MTYIVSSGALNSTHSLTIENHTHTLYTCNKDFIPEMKVVHNKLPAMQNSTQTRYADVARQQHSNVEKCFCHMG